MSRLAYRADLDGLRAVAVMPVVLYHLGVPGFSGGFVGVDVFFVLSGFLISRLIVDELAQGTFSLVSFYDRRIRRLFPALAVVLAASAIAANLLLLPDDLARFGVSLAATALAGSNFLFARYNYFEPSSTLFPLLHTWSLSVEEQFYLLFPMLLGAIWQLRPRLLPHFIWLALTLSIALSIVGVQSNPTWTFYALPTRAWEPLLGSALALGLVPSTKRAWLHEMGAAAGVVAICLAVVLYDQDTHFFAVAAPCAGAALVIWAGAQRHTWTTRLLATRLPVAIGLVSYGLYLWHWPLIAFSKHLLSGDLTPVLQVTLAVAALALAGMTWFYVEQPLRAGGWPWPTRRHRFTVAAVGLLAMAAVGASIKLNGGFADRLPPEAQAIEARRLDSSENRAACHSRKAAGWSLHRTCVLGAPVPPSVIVLADSHGVEISQALGEAARSRNQSIRQITASGCPPAVGLAAKGRPDCAEHVAATLRAVLAEPSSMVVLTAYYFKWMRSSSGAAFRVGFAETVRELRRAGHSVVILGAIPNHPAHIRVPHALARWVLNGGTADQYRFALDHRLASEIDAYLQDLASKTGSAYVPLLKYLCPDDRGCAGYRNGAVLYFDDHHVSVSGARQLVVDILEPAIWN